MNQNGQRPQPFEGLKKRLEQSVNQALLNQTEDVLHQTKQRMTMALVVYTQEFLQPLEARMQAAEERIAWLELPWYTRLWSRVASWIATRWDSAQIAFEDERAMPVRMAQPDATTEAVL